MLYGLGSALGFGVADTLAAIGTRRVGVPTTIFLIQLVDVIGLSALLLTPLPGSLHASVSASIAIVVSGSSGAVAFFCFYRALQLGPIAIVSPVFASSAAIPVILSVVFLDERLSLLAAVGAASTLCGVVLASAAHNETGDRRRIGAGGVPYALAATVAWGIASFLIGRSAKEVGWFLPVYGARLAQFAVVAAIVAVLTAVGRRPRSPSATDTAAAATAGIADVVGVALFARGSEVGLVSIVSAVSATFPIVVIAAGVALFHERPTRVQWAGILTTVVGLVVLGLGR